MEFRPLELTVISAKDIQDVKLFGKMDVYVVATIGGDPRTKQKTPIDKDGGTKPNWNFQMKFNIDEAAAQNGGLVLIFQLKCDRSMGGDKDIGEVHVPVKELLDNAESGKSAQFISYQVRKASGKCKGQLNFSYMFGDKVSAPIPAVAVSKGDEPVTAYPAAGGANAAYPPHGGGYPSGGKGYPPPPQGAYPSAPQAGYGYPPAPAGYGYPPQGVYHQPPPPPGYGYPPQQGYGYPPMQQQQAPKKNKFGMGLGAGLLGGALGGILIGDMVSDMASDGFDDDYGCDF